MTSHLDCKEISASPPFGFPPGTHIKLYVRERIQRPLRAPLMASPAHPTLPAKKTEPAPSEVPDLPVLSVAEYTQTAAQLRSWGGQSQTTPCNFAVIKTITRTPIGLNSSIF